MGLTAGPVPPRVDACVKAGVLDLIDHAVIGTAPYIEEVRQKMMVWGQAPDPFAVWLLVGLTIAFPNPIMILILLFGGLETWRRWKERKSPESREFHRVRPGTRVAIAVVYLGLAAALAVGMDATFLDRDFGDV